MLRAITLCLTASVGLRVQPDHDLGRLRGLVQARLINLTTQCRVLGRFAIDWYPLPHMPESPNVPESSNVANILKR